MSARNRFFVASGAGKTVNALYHQDNGNIGAQPVINYIEALMLTYVVTVPGDAASKQFLLAEQVNLFSSGLQQNWQRIVSGRLCL